MDVTYPFVLVLQRGERSLHDACARERFAGYQVHAVRRCVNQVANCLHGLHRHGLVHGDVKQRNVLRLGDNWVLCDMDSAAPLDHPMGEKVRQSPIIVAPVLDH